jgi:hypothetical protein
LSCLVFRPYCAKTPASAIPSPHWINKNYLPPTPSRHIFFYEQKSIATTKPRFTSIKHYHIVHTLIDLKSTPQSLLPVRSRFFRSAGVRERTQRKRLPVQSRFRRLAGVREGTQRLAGVIKLQCQDCVLHCVDSSISATCAKSFLSISRSKREDTAQKTPWPSHLE